MRVVHPNVQTIFDVAVLRGAENELVQMRQERNKYCTNRAIKTWSTFFLLKSLTESGVIKNWIKQKQWLLEYCKVTETTFRTHLKELQQLGLISIGENFSIILTSYIKAADVLGIIYKGTYSIKYSIEDGNKQTLQYLLRAEEIRNNQQLQLDALCYKIDKNPTVKDWLTPLFLKNGCSEKQLTNDPKMFQVMLFNMQQNAFIHGSEIYDVIHTLRADVNRGVKKIKEHHSYKSMASVSYLKMVMVSQGIIEVEQKMLISKNRCRLYLPKAGSDQFKKEAYKYLPKQKKTAWRITDQIKVTSSSTNHIKNNSEKSKKAA